MLVVAGLIAVAQTSGARDRGVGRGRRRIAGEDRVLDIGAGTGRSSRRRRRPPSIKNAATSGRRCRPVEDVDVQVETRRSASNVPERAPRRTTRLSLKTSGERDTWGRKFYADDSPSNLLAPSRPSRTRRPGRSGRRSRRCAGNCARSPRSAATTWSPRDADGARSSRLWRSTHGCTRSSGGIPAGTATAVHRPRVLIVRDALARRGEDWGTSRRTSRVGSCSAWRRARGVLPALRGGWRAVGGALPDGAQSAAAEMRRDDTDDDGYFNLGDYFRLMGGIDAGGTRRRRRNCGSWTSPGRTRT